MPALDPWELKYLQEIFEKEKSSAEKSSSDYLRPPFTSPLMWAKPLSRETAHRVESGYSKIPTTYQKLLQEESPTPDVPIAYLPKDSDLGGIFLRSVPPNLQGPPFPSIFATDASATGHELVHALFDRLGTLERPPRYIEEYLVRQIMGGEQLLPADRSTIAPLLQQLNRYDRYYSEASTYPRWLRKLLQFVPRQGD